MTTNATIARIQREAAEAQETMDRIRNGENPAPAPAPSSTPPPAPSSDIPPAPSADNNFGQQQTVTPIGEEPALEATQSGVISAEAFAALQQQLSTVQGRVESQAQQLSEANGRAQILQQMLLNKQAEQAAAPPAPRTRPKIANEKLIAEYGEELVGLVRDLIAEDLQFTVNPLVEQIQAVASNVSQLLSSQQGLSTQVQARVQHDFEGQLDGLVKDAKGNPDWKAIDSAHTRGDNRFVDWLANLDDTSGVVRKVIIQRLYQNQDAPRIARMINQYKAEVGLPDGTATNDSANPLPNPAAAMISPSPAAPSTPSTTRNARGQTYNMSVINKHYDDKTKGKWKGKEGEWRRIADEMDKAVRENRVVYDIR